MPTLKVNLHVGIQNNKIMLWVKVDPDSKLTKYQYIVYGTGWSFPYSTEYIGTVQFQSGFVWHVFEEITN